MKFLGQTLCYSCSTNSPFLFTVKTVEPPNEDQLNHILPLCNFYVDWGQKFNSQSCQHL